MNLHKKIKRFLKGTISNSFLGGTMVTFSTKQPMIKRMIKCISFCDLSCFWILTKCMQKLII